MLRQIELGGHVHDIGKIGVRETVLNKPGPLTAEEYQHIMTHPVLGWRILAPLLGDTPLALNIVRSHHERFDGRGVPDGLAGDEIPLEARIVAAADAFDAMTSDRPYRRGRAIDAALDELRRCAGTQFDPAIVARSTRHRAGRSRRAIRRRGRSRSPGACFHGSTARGREPSHDVRDTADEQPSSRDSVGRHSHLVSPDRGSHGIRRVDGERLRRPGRVGEALTPEVVARFAAGFGAWATADARPSPGRSWSGGTAACRARCFTARRRRAAVGRAAT